MAGKIVRVIEPQTEADPAAILVQMLVAFGNVIGRGPHFRVQAARHAANEFVAVVGDSSKARKGTSLNYVRRTMVAADNLWGERCMSTGLSTGEGLVWCLRDPITRPEPVRDSESHEIVDHEDKVVDPGVADKRLFIEETEMVRTLRVMQRDGSTLSAVLRQAWDGVPLSVLTKTSPARATDPHVSVAAHIVEAELLRELDATEGASGFGNRFLWVCARRSKTLPEGGDFTDLALGLAPLEQQLAETVRWAQTLGDVPLARTEQARGLWAEVYPALSAGSPGMVGALTARAEAHVLRLSVIFALLDRSTAIETAHLTAALAVWAYAEASVRHIFGDRLGDRVADQVLHAIRSVPAGLSRTEIRDLFARHRRAGEIEQALARLAGLNMIERRSEPTEGRPVERWVATSGASVASQRGDQGGRRSRAGDEGADKMGATKAIEATKPTGLTSDGDAPLPAVASCAETNGTEPAGARACATCDGTTLWRSADPRWTCRCYDPPPNPRAVTGWCVRVRSRWSALPGRFRGALDERARRVAVTR